MYRESKSELRKELEQLLGDADKATKEYAVIKGRSEESLREEAEGLFLRFQAAVIDPMKRTKRSSKRKESCSSSPRGYRNDD